MRAFISMILFATTSIWCQNIVAQDVATSEGLVGLRAESARGIAEAISSLPDAALAQPEIARQLTLLLNDERVVVEHLLGRETVADRAWSKLLELPSEAAVSILQEVSALKTDRARAHALEVISRIGKPNCSAYEMTLPYCTNADVYLRLCAVSALSAVADESVESVNQFGKLLLDADPSVKWTVLDALDERHEHVTKLIPEIIKLLDDDSDVHIAVSNHFSLPEKLRSRSARLLAKIGPAAADALPKLKILTTQEQDTNVRVWSAAAICKISGTPPEQTLNLLGQLLLDDMDDEFVQNDGPVAIALLGPCARPLLDSLERAKKHKSAQIRWGLVDAFFAIDPDSAVSRCLPLMEDDDEQVAKIVIQEFSERGILEPRVVSAYIRALGNYGGLFDEPANSAVDALGKIGSAANDALPALQELTRNPNVSDTLKDAVADALKRIR